MDYLIRFVPHCRAGVARWAHNPEVMGSIPINATVFFNIVFMQTLPVLAGFSYLIIAWHFSINRDVL